MGSIIGLIIGFLFIGIPVSPSHPDTMITTPKNTINISLEGGKSYQHDLGGFGDEEGVSISKQASHFSKSAIVRNPDTGKVVYTYTPAKDFIGKDVVEITSARGSDGASTNTDITHTHIVFTIKK